MQSISTVRQYFGLQFQESIDLSHFPNLLVGFPRNGGTPGEFLKHLHHIPCPAGPPHPNGQAEAAVHADHVQELEPAAVSDSVEMEVHGPDLVGLFGLMTAH